MSVLRKTDIFSSTTLLDYTAAILFWFYIAAALYFSTAIIWTIATTLVTSKNTVDIIKRQTWMYSTTAAVSFAVLSFNMVGILLESFFKWAKHHDVHYTSIVLLQEIWQWSLNTKPFYTFVLDIFSDVATSISSVAALTANLLLSIYMGIAGRQHAVPGLWRYFALAQILPISFSSSLFFLTLARSARLRQSVHPTTAFLFHIAAQFGNCIVQILVLFMQERESSWFLPIFVIVARVILLLPLQFAQAELPLGSEAEQVPTTDSRTAARVVSSVRYVALIQVLAGLFFVTTPTVPDVWQYFTLHPAANTLYCDLLLSAMICHIWIKQEHAIVVEPQTSLAEKVSSK